MCRVIEGRSWLSVNEAAKVLDLHPLTLMRKLEENGSNQNGFKLKHINDPITKRTYILKDDIDKIVKEFSRAVEE